MYGIEVHVKTWTYNSMISRNQGIHNINEPLALRNELNEEIELTLALNG